MSPATEYYNALDSSRWGRSEMPQALEVTKGWRTRTAGEAMRILELGCGRCGLAAIGAGYIGFDLALPALASAPDVARRVCGDMEQLPVTSDSIGFLFSWAAIEHVPNPERVLTEVVRVLNPGGVAILAPAWHCRTWAAEGLEFRPYSALTFRQKVRKALIPLRNLVLWRALFELPRRLLREIRYRRGQPLDFDYSRLSPNLEEYLGTDSDAFTSMDPHAAILYFASRGWEILSHPTTGSRLTARSEPVVVRKPA
jgi:SAM-dependent methyltransferase